jgi:hypothetical protein
LVDCEYFFLCGERMAELAPFAPGRAHRIPTYNFALSRVEMPPLPCAAGTF